MQMTLVVMAALGLLTLGVALFVFADSARAFVSEPCDQRLDRRPPRDPRFHVTRSAADRRCAPDHSFPCQINGLWLDRDRRSGYERRHTGGEKAM